VNNIDVGVRGEERGNCAGKIIYLLPGPARILAKGIRPGRLERTASKRRVAFFADDRAERRLFNPIR
jgi:hypothetical protein